MSLVMVTILITHGFTVADWVLGHFNNFVLTHAALYNDGYIRGAQKTVGLIKSHTYRTFINDCLAGGLLTFGSWCIGATTTLACYIYLEYIIPYPVEGRELILSYVMMLGTQIGSIFTAPIASGVHTLFIASAYDADILESVHPGLALALEKANILDADREQRRGVQ